MRYYTYMLSTLKKRIPPSLNHRVKKVINRKYREYHKELKRLIRLKRFQPGITTLLEKPIKIIDSASFVSAYNQIYINNIYSFNASSNTPTILDCGANIGLSTLYWKKAYPSSHIFAFEPDPNAYAALVTNCNEWQLSNIDLIKKAVWKSETQLLFQADGADGGHIANQVNSKSQKFTIETVRLRKYLSTKIDLLKLDIEGAEIEVLIDCADHLNNVENLFVEYHSFINREQQIDIILSILKNSGFRIHIQPELVSPRPFIQKLDSYGMDQRLNIFAYRNY